MLSSMPGQRKQMRLCKFRTLAIEEANLYDHQLRDCMRLDTAHTVASAVAPSLDKSLWQTRLCRKKVALSCCGVALCRLFESRLHILVHRADALPADVLGISPLCPVWHIAAVAAQVPDASAKAVVRVAARPDDAAALRSIAHTCLVHESTGATRLLQPGGHVLQELAPLSKIDGPPTELRRRSLSL